MGRMSDLHIEMTEDALHLLTYREFVDKWGECYEYMYDEINEEELHPHD
jgi:hypothetical protein